MDSRSKLPRFNPAVLPLEYLPRIANVSDDKHAKHYLIPGKVFAAAQPFAITTIVGSGVALCLWDSVHRVGGANHFMLPGGPEEEKESTRYANGANEVLLKKVLELGGELNNLEARIFGGSQPTLTFGNAGECVGDRNVQKVTHFLGMQGIRLVQRDVGGTRGRKLVFHTDDGRAWSQQL